MLNYKQCKITNVSLRVIFENVRSVSIFRCLKMSSKSNVLSVSPGTVLSVACLLLYSAGFIRIELKFNDHDQRLMVVEEVISQMKQGMSQTLNKGKVFSVSGNFSNIKPLHFLLLTSLSIVSVC